ncbi:MAG: Rep family protein, partial [Methanobrevibacter sp.]|nr:Rep family protein [Methanobrevibacter sp.]
HVILMFDSVKTTEQAKEVFAKIGGVGCEIVKSLRGYSRYLCHLDNPEKAQYNVDNVKSLCGADYISVIGLAIDKFLAMDEMMDFCDKYNITSFYLLSKYARVHRSDWSRVLKESGTIYMREYLKSRQWSIDNNLNNIVDPETGEILA